MKTLYIIWSQQIQVSRMQKYFYWVAYIEFIISTGISFLSLVLSLVLFSFLPSQLSFFFTVFQHIYDH